MKKMIYKLLLVVIIVSAILFQNVSNANMADFTDEQADNNLKHEQEEFKKEQEQNIDKSSNNYLKNISIKGYDISPVFDKQIINYEVSKDVSDESIEIEVETDDEKATVIGTGKITLNSGENNLEIKVTAENGMTRTYFIKVNKIISKDVKLKSIKLSTESKSDIALTPEFNENIYEYTCEVENYVNKINIDTNAGDKNTKVEITGADNLQEGTNAVLVKVSDNSENKAVYRINVLKHSKAQIEENKQEINYKYIVACIIIAIVIVFIIITLLKKKNKGRH